MNLPVLHGSFKLAKASGGVSRFARVSVEIVCGGEGMDLLLIQWKEDALTWNDEPCKIARQEEDAIHRGVAMAQGSYPGHIARVTICRVEASYTDTTDDCLTYATCFAVWDALRICACNPPRLEAGKFIFPETP